MVIMAIMDEASSEHPSVAEAKARFSHYLRSAESGQAVVITRRGRPVAALVSASDLAEIERLRAAGPEKGLAGLAGGWEGSDELRERIEIHSRTLPRGSPHSG
jgi:prevent-host-death family protein